MPAFAIRRASVTLRISFIPTFALALVLACLGLMRQSDTVLAATIRTYPGASAPCNSTLQACIDGSAAGDTIQIAAGTFITNEILINKAMTLSGAGASSTVLQALVNQRVISVSSNLADGVVIADLRITGGNIASDGAGLYSQSGTPLTLRNVDVRDNTGIDPSFRSGGGAFVFGPLHVINSTFANNHVTNGEGGGVYVATDATISGTIFTQNSARFGGGLRVSNNVEIATSHFLTNVATDDGGGVLVDGSFVTVTASSFVSNTAAESAGGLWAEVNALITETDFISNRSGATAGGLQVNGGIGRVTGGSFVGNRVGPNFVDGDEQGGGALYQNNGTLLLTAVLFRDNASQGNGGAVGARSALSITGGLFEGNRADSSGGGIYQEPKGPGTLMIASASFAGNEAGFGGGIYTYAPLTITNTSFVSNTGENYGGALFSNALSVISGGQFVGNRTTITVEGSLVGGGAIYADAGDVVIRNTDFVENVSAQQGGAMLMTDNAGVSFDVSGSSFVGNQAQTGGAIEGAGTITIAASHFAENEAAREGGAVVSFGPLFISATNFFSNSATYGGGVAAAGTAAINDSRFVSNTATSEGGALSSSGHSLITASEFDGNQANLGGALWLGVLNGNSVDRAIFSRNRATDDGGAIFVIDSTALTLTNSLLVANSAGDEGGAIASITPSLRVVNVTLVANRAITGGAIMIRSGGITLSNSIVWENGVDPIASTIPLGISGTNIIEEGDFGGLDQDPRFVRNPNAATDDLGDMRLGQLSPAIDGGDGGDLPSSFTLDLDGAPRRVDITAVADAGSGTPPIDLGAYEVNNQFPIADAGGPYSGNEGSPIALDGSGSSSGDNDEAISAFAWDCTNDGSFDGTIGQPTGAACRYADQGEFTVGLRVTDAGGFTAVASATVSVQNVAPTLGGQSNQSAVINQAKSFSLGAFDDPGADSPWQVSVAWGDGQSSVLTRTVTGTLPATSHTYATSGVFTATITVTDKDGGEDSATFRVTVEGEAGPVLEYLFLPLLYKEG